MDKLVQALQATMDERWLDQRAFIFQQHVNAARGNHSDTLDQARELASATSLGASAVSAVGLGIPTTWCTAQMKDASIHPLIRATAADRVAPGMFDLDFVQRADPCAAPSDMPHEHRHLRERGWLKVDDWGLDLHALKMQSKAVLDEALGDYHGRRRNTKIVSIGNPSIPAMLPLLQDRKLASMLEDYMGGPVRYDGFALLHVMQGVTPASYTSAHWHHDRCGSRMKVFVFLHDVEPGGRPTVVADRTHRTWYYWQYRGPQASRFDASYVTSRHKVVPMLGRAGGGFIFDTNAMHRGMHEGNHTRTTLILEFHRHGKVPGLQALGHDGPCPSLGSQGSKRGNGLAGLPLFPQEASSRRVAAQHA